MWAREIILKSFENQPIFWSKTPKTIVYLSEKLAQAIKKCAKIGLAHGSQRFDLQILSQKRAFVCF